MWVLVDRRGERPVVAVGGRIEAESSFHSLPTVVLTTRARAGLEVQFLATRLHGLAQVPEAEHPERVADLLQQLDLRGKFLDTLHPGTHEDVQHVLHPPEVLADRLGDRLHELDARCREALARLLHLCIARHQAGEVEGRTDGGHTGAAGAGPGQALQDLANVRQFLAGTGALAFFDTPWLPVYLLVIGLVHPLLALFAVVVVVVLFSLTWLNEWRTHKPITEANKEAMATNQFVNNNLRHAEALKALGMVGAMRRRWSDKQAKVLALQTFASEEGARIGSLGKAARMLFQSLILGMGAWLAIQDQITPGGMIAGSILLGRTLAPVELLIGAWKQWISASDAHQRLDELLASQPAPAEGVRLPAPKGAIALEDVAAVPPGGKTPVLQGLSFRIEPADVVIVAGPSGCGKSTLARLIVGVWPPARGMVRLDGADVFAWDKELLGPHVGYLPQEIALFDGTVAENIGRFGELDSEAVVRAAQQAGMHEMILRLPQGYDTPVGADGAGLSGGQRQRIALARALYRTPALVVLDEPNANLDEAGDAALLAALRTLRERGSMVVLMTHRRSILDLADRVLLLQGGRTLAFGPRDEVLQRLVRPAVTA